MRVRDLTLLRCPACHATLDWHGSCRANGTILDGVLGCTGCGARWPVVDGMPRLYREQEVRGTDRLMRWLYDAGARLHDPAVRHILPLVEREGSEQALRDGYMRRVDLAGLAPPAGRPARVLEVGVGAGANLPLIRRDLAAGIQAEVFGMDLSAGMIAECRKRIRKGGLGDVRLLMADAHALPFPDASFDRVFHVGGIGGFRDPGRALAEMARVAVPGTPIVVVDEQLDSRHRRSLWHRAFFRLLTFYDPDPHCPRELLPRGAILVIEEQLSPFYYCLTFRMPPA